MSQDDHTALAAPPDPQDHPGHPLSPEEQDQSIAHALRYHPGDSYWVRPFLKAVSEGHPVTIAAVEAGVTLSTASTWKQRSPSNLARYMRARLAGKQSLRKDLRSVAFDQAKRGNTWFYSMAYAMADPKEFKALRAHVREADPDMRHLSVVGGNSGDPLAGILSINLDAPTPVLSGETPVFHTQDAPPEIPPVRIQAQLAPAQEGAPETETEPIYD